MLLRSHKLLSLTRHATTCRFTPTACIQARYLQKKKKEFNLKNMKIYDDELLAKYAKELGIEDIVQMNPLFPVFHDLSARLKQFFKKINQNVDPLYQITPKIINLLIQSLKIQAEGTKSNNEQIQYDALAVATRVLLTNLKRHGEYEVQPGYSQIIDFRVCY
jgi:hypothetical protein